MTITQIWNSITGLFNWNKTQSEVNAQQKTKTTHQAGQPVDKTEGMVANKQLTKGVFFNTFPGMKLGAGLAFPILMIPILFMGVPVVRTIKEGDNDTLGLEIDETLKLIQNNLHKKHKQLQLESDREGTVYAFPRFNARSKKIQVELIQDNTVTLVKDINTSELIALYTDEQLKFNIEGDIMFSGESVDSVTVRRIRKFTKTKIKVEYRAVSGTMPPSLKDKSNRNVVGILPIPFANNPDSDEIRGHSVIERILSPLKNYHDVMLALVNFLAKFKPKMVQGVQDGAVWKANNSVSDLNDYDVANTDLIINIEGKESTNYVFPQGAVNDYIEALKIIFKVIVESGVVPEVVLGVKTTGNSQTSEQAMESFIKMVGDKRNEKNQSYKDLYESILLLQSIATGQDLTRELTVTWNELSAVSDETRAKIFKDFAEGISKLMNVAGMTKDQLFKIWEKWFPDSTADDFDIFVIGLSDMGRHKQWTNATLEEGNQDRGLETSPELDALE